MRYVLEQKRKNSGFAGAKAPRDVGIILNSIGFQTLYYSDISSKNILWRHVVSFFMILRLILILRPKDECFIQWPLYTKFDSMLYLILKWKHIKFCVLIHDSKFIRYGKSMSLEKKFYQMSSTIISHTDNMKHVIVKMGVNEKKIHVLNSFDYLIDECEIPKRSLSTSVAYAGNFYKASFLNNITNHPIGVPLFCYGRKNIDFSGDLIYKGFFHSDNVSKIEGSWGLVWDGDSEETCNGVYGEYLKMNSPHKLSLYIVARLPLIVWKESGLTDYVLKRNLGIAINSLRELPNRLKEITEKDYNYFLTCVDKERLDLINGNHLKGCITMGIGLEE